MTYMYMYIKNKKNIKIDIMYHRWQLPDLCLFTHPACLGALVKLLVFSNVFTKALCPWQYKNCHLIKIFLVSYNLWVPLSLFIHRCEILLSPHVSLWLVANISFRLEQLILRIHPNKASNKRVSTDSMEKTITPNLEQNLFQ